jgi:hypothetical protein
MRKTTLWFGLLFGIGFILFLSACGINQPKNGSKQEQESTVAISEDPTAAPTVTTEVSTSSPPTAEPTAAPHIAGPAASQPTSSPQLAFQDSPRLSDSQTAKLLEDLIGSDQDAADSALQTASESGDSRFIGVLLELLRARQIGLVSGSYSDYVAALEELSRQSFGDNWPAWVEWYGKTDLQPPPGFTGWKGRLLSKLDSGFEDFFQDGFPSRIRVEEIMWGGVPIDGIPPLEHAPTLAGVDVDYLLDEEPVFGVVVNGDARAYPLRIIDNHEMANDFIGGVPVSLAYCTLCGAAIAYDGRASNGETYDFGTSGFLYRSNKLMYDRQTRSLWNQLTGEPVLGELADDDVHLEILPIVLTTWADWLDQHPDTLVLDRETGYYNPDMYIPGIFYGDYFSGSDTMFPVWQRSDLLPDKEFIYALHLNGEPKAYQIEALVNDGVLNDTLGGEPIVLVANRGSVSVEGWHRFQGDVVYDAGGEVRAFNRGDETFIASDDPDVILDSDGNQWRVTEDALIGPEGQSAERVNGHLAYWFGWYAFFPNTLLYSTTSGSQP